MNMNYLKQATNEYLEIYQDKKKSFDRFNPILPVHMKEKLETDAKILKQMRLEPSIYARAAIKEYLEHIKNLYSYDDYNHFAETTQVSLQLSDECYADIQTITNITRDKRISAIVSRALEHSFTNVEKLYL